LMKLRYLIGRLPECGRNYITAQIAPRNFECSAMAGHCLPPQSELDGATEKFQQRFRGRGHIIPGGVAQQAARQT
jgi:hypothetical protein